MTSNDTDRRTVPPAPRRPVAALQCYLAYGSALLAGALSWTLLQRQGLFADPYWLGFAVTCICTVVIWVFSIANDNSSIYDPYWVVAPPLLALALKATAQGGLGGAWHARQLIIAACLCIWACRYHVFYAWPGWRTGLVHEDWRYEAMRRAPLPYWLNSLIGMHLFPTVLVYLAFAPAARILLSSPESQPAFGLWDLLATAGALGAVSIEYLADRQLRRYRGTNDYERGGTFRQGLWKYSRHPNYFGEALFWVSMVPFAVAGGLVRAHPLLVFAGPILMAAFFRYSCRLMDVRSLERRPDYARAIAETSAMIPWWPRTRRYDRQRSSVRGT
jgi:steroid 5-alpha reductase family enzyme